MSLQHDFVWDTFSDAETTVSVKEARSEPYTVLVVW